MAMMAAIKNVLSPISEAPMTPTLFTTASTKLASCIQPLPAMVTV
jgi:hypothetical protein